MSGDGAECLINDTICTLRQVYSPSSSHPPLGGGTETVRFFAGEATPLSVVDLHVNQYGCDKDPFLWVRLLRRFRSRAFPQPYVGPDNCTAMPVIAIEIGVARCAALTNPESTMDDYAKEAEISLDDSWRIEYALCAAATRMREQKDSDMVALDYVTPYGPEGGVIAWMGTLYARVDR